MWRTVLYPGTSRERRPERLRFFKCEAGPFRGLLPGWRASCGVTLVGLPSFPPSSMRWN